jgi:hypothetical protein
MSTAIPVPTLHVTLNLQRPLGLLQLGVDKNMVALRSSLRSLEDGSLKAKGGLPRPGTLLQFSLDPPIKQEDEAARLCNRAFVSIVAELVACIDRFIALDLTIARRDPLPTGLASEEDVRKYIDTMLEEDFGIIAGDKRRSSPAKLETFVGIDAFAREAALSFFDVRPSVEHHDSRANKDLTLRYWRLKLMSGDLELTAPGQPGKLGEGISLGADHVAKAFPSGSQIRLEEADLECIAMTATLIVGPELLRVVTERLAPPASPTPAS